MFGNMGDMSKMLEGLQDQAKKMEEDSAHKTFTSKVGGGMLSVEMNGKGEMIDINIDDSLLEDKLSLQILIMSAINDVNKMVLDDKKNAALGMLGGMNPFGQN